MERRYDFPVWETQGGGLVRRRGDSYYFVEIPETGGHKVKGEMPTDWQVIPHNNLARIADGLDPLDGDEFPDVDPTFDAAFDTRLMSVETGETSLDELGDFFSPQRG